MRWLGITSQVTAVMAAPQPTSSSPRFTWRRESCQHMPESKMNVQQMLCCQMYPGSPVYQALGRPKMSTRSYMPW